jgi:hypothetical protein
VSFDDSVLRRNSSARRVIRIHFVIQILEHLGEIGSILGIYNRYDQEKKGGVAAN